MAITSDGGTGGLCLNEKDQILCPNKNLCDRQMEIDGESDLFMFHLLSWRPHFNFIASQVAEDGIFDWEIL